MSETGQLRVSARFGAAGLTDVQVVLTRPQVTRLFVGQTPAVVVKTVPYLYALCAEAQRAAAALALAAAGGDVLPPPAPRKLWIECLHEHLWRLLLDWPLALGEPPEREVYAAWRALRHDDRVVEETRYLLANVLQPLAHKCLRGLVDRDTEAAARVLPALDPEAWLAAWQQGVRVIPAYPASVAAAYSQRLNEVRHAFAALAGGAPYPLSAAGGGGAAVGQAMTARGVLTHAVRLQDARVADYRIEAPTDAYFVDPAALCSLLASQPAATADAARRALAQAVLALDPCVPFVVELSNA